MPADSSKSSQSSSKLDGPRFDRLLRIGTVVVLVLLLGVTSAILGVVAKQDSDSPVGTEVAQELVGTTTTTIEGAPEASSGGSAAASESVSDEPVEVPMVVWLQEEEAEAALSAAGLGWETEYTPHWLEDEWGVVIGQDPYDGEMVPMGTIVKITVHAEGVKIPDVVGMDTQEAPITLAADGLAATYLYQATSNSAKWGKVIAQDPPGGYAAFPGDVVTLTIGKAPTTTSSTLILAPPSSLPVFNP